MSVLLIGLLVVAAVALAAFWLGQRVTPESKPPKRDEVAHLEGGSRG